MIFSSLINSNLIFIFPNFQPSVVDINSINNITKQHPYHQTWPVQTPLQLHCLLAPRGRRDPMSPWDRSARRRRIRSTRIVPLARGHHLFLSHLPIRNHQPPPLSLHWEMVSPCTCANPPSKSLGWAWCGSSSSCTDLAQISPDELLAGQGVTAPPATLIAAQVAIVPAA